MPSSYSASARFVLQATGENNNTWGVILNQGAFQLIDDNINGRLPFALSGTRVLTTANGAPDEARMAFLDVTGGAGGVVTVPPVPKGYFIRNNAAGDVAISVGGPINAVFKHGDMGPCFTDGAGAVFQILLSNLPLRDFIAQGDQAVIDYVNLAISSGSIALPPPTPVGAALMVRNVGGPPTPAWTPSLIQTADVQGLAAALAAMQTLITANTALAVAMAVAL